MQFDNSRGLLFGALLTSLLMHLLLVFGWGWARPMPPVASQRAMQAVVLAKPAAPLAAPAPVTTQANVVTPVPKRMSEAISSPVLALEKGSAAPAPAPALSVSPGPVASERTASVAALAGEAGRSAISPEGISADGLRQYRIELAGAARRFRNYPALARARGWEGVVEISIAVDAGGALPSLRLVRASGHEILDEQALAMLSRAVASTPLPESLRGHSFVVPMPIRFSLEE